MYKLFSAALAVAIVTAWSGATRAQEGTPNEWLAGNDDWANPANWSVFALPQGDPYEEHAIISNGGVATVIGVIAEERVVLRDIGGDDRQRGLRGPGQMRLGQRAE